VSFEQTVRVSLDRIGALVGTHGAVKNEIERGCGVTLRIDSDSGEVMIKSRTDLPELKPFKAVDIVNAIARGFSPERAFRLFDDDAVLNTVDLRLYAGKSESAMTRIKGRIIGLRGKSRKLLEELTGAYVSVYGHSVAALGTVSEVKLATDAIERLSSGSSHRTVYDMLQKSRTKAKLARMMLWEKGSVGQ